MSEIRRQAQRLRGFTLIELLIVIGIIALLAAVLFPVFAHIRARAYQTTCSSNLKQIGIAMQLYTQDSDGMMFPALPHADGNGGIAEWCFYKDFNPEPRADKSRGPLSIYIKTKDIWICPAAPDLMVPYGLNSDLVTAEADSQRPVQLAQVSVPSETILVTECSFLAATPEWWEAEPFVHPPSKRVPVVNGRHFGLANVLWFDGHVSAKRPIASYPAKFSKGELQINQLQQLNQGDILKSAYTGKAKQDDYYYELSKANP